MNEMDEWSDVFYFITLEMTDIMPTGICWKLRLFIYQLLYIVFAEITLSLVVQRFNIFNGLGFRDGYEQHLITQFSPDSFIVFEINCHGVKIGNLISV